MGKNYLGSDKLPSLNTKEKRFLANLAAKEGIFESATTKPIFRVKNSGVGRLRKDSTVSVLHGVKTVRTQSNRQQANRLQAKADKMSEAFIRQNRHGEKLEKIETLETLKEAYFALSSRQKRKYKGLKDFIKQKSGY